MKIRSATFKTIGSTPKLCWHLFQNLASLIFDDSDLHCSGSAFCHVEGASTKEEVLNATNEEMVEAIDTCFDGGSECRKMIIGELDSLDRDLFVSIDIDVHLDPELSDDYDTSWRVCYSSSQAVLLDNCSLLT